MADQERTPVDDLVDLLVYAPIGLLYEYEDVLSQLVKRGKSQVQLARLFGKVAADRGGSDPMNMAVGLLASTLARRLTELGSSIGLAPPVEGGPGLGPAATPEIADGRPDGETVADGPLPIASYDRLTAREIIGLLDELDADQLARIRAHEQANRARKTVLGKLDRLAS